MDQARLNRRYIANDKRFSDLHSYNLPLINACGREDDMPLCGLPRPQEQVNTGSFQRFQEVCFALGDFRDRCNPFSQAGGCCRSKGYRAALLGERRSLEWNNGIPVYMADEYDIVVIDVCPSLCMFSQRALD